MGKEDKGGFTVMFGSTADPTVNDGLLPMLIITKSKTAQAISKILREDKAGAHFAAREGEKHTGSKTAWAYPPPFHRHTTDGHIITAGGHTHWMNPPALKLWITEIVWPAHVAACQRGAPGAPGMPLDPLVAHSVVHIDAYPVHIDKMFIAWLKKHYPQLLPLFVPANCTGKMQVADVLYNRPLKSAFTALQMKYLTDCVVEQVSEGVAVSDISFATKKVSVAAGEALPWLLQAWEGVRSADLAGTLKSIGYAKCFDDAGFRRLSARAWGQDVGEVPDVPEPDLEDEAAAMHDNILAHGGDPDQEAWYDEE